MSEILRKLVEDHKSTQGEIAKASGISAGQLSDLLNGNKQFTMGQLDQLCFTLNVPTRSVVKRADEETRERYIDGFPAVRLSRNR